MVNDYFKGSEMSVLNCDKFAAQHIRPEDIQVDLELMEKKYWDYKMWHPTKATMYFAHRYHAIASKVMEREVGGKQAAGYRVKAARFDLRYMPLATIRAFWKARQYADAIGCTYDVYIRASIRHFRANHRMYASVKASGFKQHMPYPAQIASQYIIDQAMKDWTEEKKARFPLPQHADILGNPDLWFRPEMEAWIIEEANKTGFARSFINAARESGALLGSA